MGKGAKVKGYIKSTNTGRIFKFQYNPTTFSTGRSVNFSELDSPGTAYPKFQYTGGSSRGFDLELFLYGGRKDSWKAGGKKYPMWFIKQMRQFLPAEKNVATFKSPQELIVARGAMVDRCILVGMDEVYEEFHADLTPKIIRVTLKFKVVV